MGILPSQMVEILEEQMAYEDFQVLERIIEEIFWAEKPEDRKNIIEKLRGVLNG